MGLSELKISDKGVVQLEQQININDPAQVFGKVFRDGIKNIFFFGIGAAVIAFIINVLEWRIFGFILGCVYALLGAWEIVTIIFLIIMQIVGFIILLANPEKKGGRQQGLLFAGLLVRTIEGAMFLLYVAYLYNAYYKKDLLGIFS